MTSLREPSFFNRLPTELTQMIETKKYNLEKEIHKKRFTLVLNELNSQILEFFQNFEFTKDRCGTTDCLSWPTRPNKAYRWVRLYFFLSWPNDNEEFIEEASIRSKFNIYLLDERNLC